jgi:DNA-binding response OmpR family regulator
MQYMRVLLVEDNKQLGHTVKEALELEGYAVDLVADFEGGLAYGESETYDLIVLDRMLPDGHDGLQICRLLRERGIQTPTLVLTARGELQDKVSGLKIGADDYLVKPFELSELLARMEALIRRPPAYQSPFIALRDIKINASDKTVSRNGAPVPLTPKEFMLLVYLARHKDKVVSKEELVHHAWNFDADVLPKTVEVFIFNLRKKLDTPGKPSVIQTIRGFGYKVDSHEE